MSERISEQERQQAEADVRGYWDEPVLNAVYRSAGQMDSGAEPDELIIYTRQNVTLARVWGSAEEAWAAAAQYTDEHKRKRADLEEEISWLSMMSAALEGDSELRPMLRRMYDRTSAALADHMRGVKQ